MQAIIAELNQAEHALGLFEDGSHEIFRSKVTGKIYQIDCLVIHNEFAGPIINRHPLVAYRTYENGHAVGGMFTCQLKEFYNPADSNSVRFEKVSAADSFLPNPQ